MRKRAKRTRIWHSLFALSRLEIWGSAHDARSSGSGSCRNTREVSIVGQGSGHKIRGKVSRRSEDKKSDVIILCHTDLSLNSDDGRCAYLSRLSLRALAAINSLSPLKARCRSHDYCTSMPWGRAWASGQSH